jgi:glucose/arabinose dehydrogenase
MKRSLGYLTLALGGLLAVNNAGAQAWTSAYASATATGDCAGLPASLDSSVFRVTPIVSRTLQGTGIARPMKMAFDLNGTSGLADIYFTLKYGDIMYFNSQTQTVTNLGRIPGVWRTFQEDGLGGIALDPNFKTNNYIYVSFSYRNGDTATAAAAASQSEPSATVGLRVSRFTLNATTKMVDTASQKLVIHIPAAMGERYHTGGSLHFDGFGNLYVSAGDNEALFTGAGNTADLRGAILRVKPAANGGYTIPAGNFGAYWAAQFTSQGRTTLAAQYLDTSKVRPEIYVKGTRNPYVFGVDKSTLGRITWAECGPDNQRQEEANFSNVPAFSGFPFWAGAGVRQTTFDNTYNETGDVNSSTLYAQYNPVTMLQSNPVNTWPATGAVVPKGVDSLPAMHRPIASWTGNAPVGSGTGNTCAMGGPYIRYNGSLANPGKLPPHLNNTVLWGDFAGQTYYLRKIDASGNPTDTNYQVFTSATYPRSTTAPAIGRHIDLQQGPDGSLYLLNHGAGCCNGNSGGQSAYTGIVRITYKGTCKDPGLNVAVDPQARVTRDASWLKVGSRMFSVFAQGPHEATILDMSGRVLFTFRGEGPQVYNLPAALGAGGVYVLRVRTAEATAVRPLAGL